MIGSTLAAAQGRSARRRGSQKPEADRGSADETRHD
jgi:hypothetical protein